ncbi:MAG TPA: TrpB-like pyridoxal phosphate-dependent enzyme, partial [Actinomycetota bacterium]|nr:TrpB-like pyridoxal phosphate-dependent enzyme [Actinomycetota bacterium]
MPREDVNKIVLADSDLPTAWYNILPDLPGEPMPPLHPGTMQPVGPADLAPLFPEALIMQEVSTEGWIDIPGPILDVYRIWRPTPLVRARRLERSLGLDGKQRIYYKWEGVSPAGSHKPNTAVAQAYYNKEAGIRKLTTETGAGQWGSALALACQFFDLECLVFMVKVSYEQKPYRRVLMQTWGAEVVPSPSEETQAGRNVLAEHPDSTGSLGIAISEAVEVAAQNADTNYSLGSVLNHVCMHQTVVGLEAQKQMEAFEDVPDIVIGCVGGGSNYAGLSFPFVGDALKNGA